MRGLTESLFYILKLEDHLYSIDLLASLIKENESGFREIAYLKGS